MHLALSLMADQNPITTQEFSEIMKGLGLGPKDGPFAVAVSGGPDSMALAHLMTALGEVHYLTFDHGLRDGSAEEAEKVHGWLLAKGLSHHTLKINWNGELPKTGIQEAARQARYEALEGWCRKNKIKYLVTAHHLEDQAETFLMRLFKGSGVDGLSAMAPKSAGLFAEGITVLRPLLGVSKERLKATLKAHGQLWIEDPSNENLDFTRIKIRKALERSKNLNSKILALMADRLGKVRWILETLSRDLLKKTLKTHKAGYQLLSAQLFLESPEELAHRSLSKVLMFTSQASYPPNFEKVRRLLLSLGSKEFRGSTLSGCKISFLGGDEILICREPRDVKEALSLNPGQKKIWDNRFEVSFEGGKGPLEVKVLGKAAWVALAAENPEVKKVEIPHQARTSLPTFFREGEVVLVPHLNFSREGFRGKAIFKPKTQLFQENQSRP